MSKSEHKRNEENLYRRIDRYASEKYEYYANACRTAKQAIANHCRTQYEESGYWKYVKRTVAVITVIGVWVYTIITINLLSNAQSQLIQAHRQADAAEKNIPRSWLYVEFPKESPRPEQAGCAPPIYPAFPPFQCIETVMNADGSIGSYVATIAFKIRNYGHIPAQIGSASVQLLTTPVFHASAEFALLILTINELKILASLTLI